MKLIVGLGNPGDKYARNRHNVGFMAVDEVVSHHGLSPWRRKFQGLISDGTLDGERVLVLKPQTYMNDSGQSVGEAARFHKIEEADIIVLYDEIDLAAGKLKVKSGGGNAGHNGLRSMSAHVGNDYVRVRIGVGHPGQKHLVANYVLSDFSKSDTTWLEPMLDEIARASGLLAKGDTARFLTDVSRRLSETDASPSSAPAQSALPKKATAPGATGRPVRSGGAQRKASGGHPAGERASKRQGALAENLKNWLKGRDGS
ncbi:MAG: aminoacyl-tRNA hydrolase [Pseudomonadota bacterium]